MSGFPALPRRVIVTGAASGIGKATALLLRELGVEVVAADRSAEGLADVAAAGGEPVAIDVTSADDRARLLGAAGEVDGLVNAAGIIRLTRLEDVSDRDWDSILSVNLKGSFYLARDVGLRMPRGGSIVNLSSLAARTGTNVEVLCYAASKAAILSVTRSLAHAFGARGVRVNAVLPGIIDTPMGDAVREQVSAIRGVSSDDVAASRAQLAPLERRQGTPRECAETIVFLLSGASSFVTGQSLSIDGGAVMP